MANNTGKVDVEAINGIKDPREFLLNACKAGSSKTVACPKALVKRALGAAAKELLDTCKGNSVDWTKLNRKMLVKALEATPTKV